ncbi:MAG: hypothetical protein PHU91_04025 [Candidatus Omnitrophica bacterium]|nr:hypothetical protein [Candidatus Omnitrophota bacterium]MDD5236808.1 hypothetical protein [Candidatus Omnitrophota bacterium]MDD5610334.1 hypothetical protein [Candidatus Omnitrophota bacterium]
MKKIAGLIMCVAILIATSGLTHAAEPWVLLGQRVISDQPHDIIYLTTTEEFRAIKIAVFKKPVEFKDVKVSFAYGTSQNIKISRIIKPRENPEVIDLVGKKRVIKRIELQYNTKSLSGRKAIIRIFGLKARNAK